MTFEEFLDTIDDAATRQQWAKLDSIARAYFVEVECCNASLNPDDVTRAAHVSFCGILPRTGNDDADIATLLLEIIGGVESLDVETLRAFFDLKRYGREMGYYYDIAEGESDGRVVRYLFKL